MKISKLNKILAVFNAKMIYQLDTSIKMCKLMIVPMKSSAMNYENYNVFESSNINITSDYLDKDAYEWVIDIIYTIVDRFDSNYNNLLTYEGK